MCTHPDFAASVTVNRLEDAGRFIADVKIQCSACGAAFRFLGLPSGIDLNGASVNVDGTEARLAIAPPGQVASLVDGAPQGFTVRRN